jgi:hypothetical protein
VAVKPAVAGLKRALLDSDLADDVVFWPAGPGVPRTIRALVRWPGGGTLQVDEEGRIGAVRVASSVRHAEFAAPALATEYPDLVAIENPRRSDYVMWRGERWRLDSDPTFDRDGGTWVAEMHYLDDRVP